jgi:hypothetical protein
VRRPQIVLVTRGLPGALAVKLFPNWFTLNMWSETACRRSFADSDLLERISSLACLID